MCPCGEPQWEWWQWWWLKDDKDDDDDNFDDDDDYMNIIKLFNVMGNNSYNKGDGDDNAVEAPQGAWGFSHPNNILFPQFVPHIMTNVSKLDQI